jgi:voltage-gated potassium channel
VSRVERWERRTEIPLLLLALAFLVAYAWPVLDPSMDPDLRTFLAIASWTVWVAFGVDFAVRIVLAEDRRRYAVRHWYDVALIALPMLRPLRLLRVLALARILNRSATSSLVGRVSTYVVGSALMAVVLGSVAILDVEQDAADANITTYGDALWWAATTVTTVGYGDRYPVTGAGRFVAVALMVAGIALVGAVTASIAAWMWLRSSKSGSRNRAHEPFLPHRERSLRGLVNLSVRQDADRRMSGRLASREVCRPADSASCTHVPAAVTRPCQIEARTTCALCAGGRMKGWSRGSTADPTGRPWWRHSRSTWRNGVPTAYVRARCGLPGGGKRGNRTGGRTS